MGASATMASSGRPAVLLTVLLLAAPATAQNGTSYEPGPRICDEGGVGTFLPAGEEAWSDGGRGVLYALLLGYTFAGVACMADAFMGAIETITSRTVTKTKENGDQFDIDIWNPTVANLTLMALGSSAPEIILAIYEVIKNDFYAGDLGPGTIVGSAAFNLMLILGYCTYTLGAEERKIDRLQVFGITSFFSIFAYLWLVFVLEATSPNVVEIWEAVVTFLWFPLLVAVAWFTDKRNEHTNKVKPSNTDNELADVDGDNVKIIAMHKRGTDGEGEGTLQKDMIESFLKRKQASIRDGPRAEMTADSLGEMTADSLASEFFSKKSGHGVHSRAYYRRMAIRSLRVRNDIHPPRVLQEFRGRGSVAVNKTGEQGNTDIGFAHTRYSVHMTKGEVTVHVTRGGDLRATVLVEYETRDCSVTTAAHKDYEPLTGTLEFKTGEQTKEVTIKLLHSDDDDLASQAAAAPNHGPSVMDDAFVVVLTTARFAEDEGDAKVTVGNDEAVVLLVNSGSHGELNMSCAVYKILECQPTVEIKVLRVGGAKGVVSCSFATKDGTAVAPADYTAVSGTLEFAPGETEKGIVVNIIDDDVYERDEDFYLAITDATGGARIGSTYKSTITIVNDDVLNGLVNKIDAVLNFNKDKFKLSKVAWAANIKECLTVPSDRRFLTTCAWIIMLPWNLVVAVIIPPVSLLGAWPTFFVALFLTGFTTAIIGDLASLFGCIIGLSDYVTAITIVALGTSLPDTFASAYAAKHDSNADAAIGNVTGSNSVNVFLGLGIAWLVGSLYWEGGGNGTLEWKQRVEYYPGGIQVVQDFPNGAFFVSKGIVSFSVIVYCVCAGCTIAILCLRRKFAGAELGGKGGVGISVVLVCLWAVFIALSTLKSEGVM